MFYGKQKTKSIWSLFQDHCSVSETHTKKKKTTILQFHYVLWKTENQNNFWVWSLDPSVQKDNSSTVMLQCVLTVATYWITGMSKFMEEPRTRRKRRR